MVGSGNPAWGGRLDSDQQQIIPDPEPGRSSGSFRVRNSGTVQGDNFDRLQIKIKMFPYIIFWTVLLHKKVVKNVDLMAGKPKSRYVF